MSEILVSISVLTYNHEDYIEKCLNSILNQKVNFKFEIIVGEDCSTDQTLSICKKIASEYPDIVKVLHHSVNLGLLANTVNNLKHCQGKYIAMCDGDDYWIDVDKLQKQVDFMERYPSFSMCFSRCAIDSLVNIVYTKKFKLPKSEELSAGRVILNHYIPTSSLLFRSELLDDTIYYVILKSHVNDLPLEIMLSTRGRVKFFDEIFSGYRISPNSFTANLIHQEKATLGQIKMYLLLNKATSWRYFFYFFVMVCINLLIYFKKKLMNPANAFKASF